MRKMLLAVFILMLGSCAITHNSDSWQNNEIFQNISVKHDSFSNQTSYSAPAITTDNILSKKTWFVRVFKLHDSTLYTQLHVSFFYSDSSWRHIGKAKSKGESFPTRSIRQSVTNCNENRMCNYHEDLIISVSLDKLKNLVNENGLVFFEITDRFGESWLVNLSARYIEALEAKLEA